MKDSLTAGRDKDNTNEDPKTKGPDAIEAGARLLSYKEWTKNGLTERLAERGYSAPEIEEAVIWLEEQGLIDDNRYAFEFASGKMRTRLWGIIKISAELKRRGIGAELAEEALAPLKGEAEETAALKALQKWLRIKRLEPSLSREITIKASSHLRSKGFTGQAISFAMNRGSKEDPYFYED